MRSSPFAMHHRWTGRVRGLACALLTCGATALSAAEQAAESERAALPILPIADVPVASPVALLAGADREPSLVLLPGEASFPAEAGAPPDAPPAGFVEAGWRQQGMASWYGGHRWHGRRTASGEAFDRHALTAAHRSLPLGSWVRVFNPANGVAVVVRINDRGPFARNRIIDLSEAAADLLGLRHAGRARVDVSLLSAP